MLADRLRSDHIGGVHTMQAGIAIVELRDLVVITRRIGLCPSCDDVSDFLVRGCKGWRDGNAKHRRNKNSRYGSHGDLLNEFTSCGSWVLQPAPVGGGIGISDLLERGCYGAAAVCR